MVVPLPSFPNASVAMSFTFPFNAPNTFSMSLFISYSLAKNSSLVIGSNFCRNVTAITNASSTRSQHSRICVTLPSSCVSKKGASACWTMNDMMNRFFATRNGTTVLCVILLVSWNSFANIEISIPFFRALSHRVFIEELTLVAIGK